MGFCGESRVMVERTRGQASALADEALPRFDLTANSSDKGESHSFAFAHTHTHTYTHIHIHTHSLTHAFIHAHTLTHTYTYTHMNTRTRQYWCSPAQVLEKLCDAVMHKRAIKAHQQMRAELVCEIEKHFERRQCRLAVDGGEKVRVAVCER